jgi:hypothetical protein
LSELKDREIITEAKEIMAIFPTVKSVLSTYNSALIPELLFTMRNIFNDSDNNHESVINNNPKVRIIVPQDKEIDNIIKDSGKIKIRTYAIFQKSMTFLSIRPYSLS